MILNTSMNGSNKATVHAGSWPDVVEQVRRNPEVSLVLIDIMMLEMDSFGVTRLTRELRP